jgi:hypothetical protein
MCIYFQKSKTSEAILTGVAIVNSLTQKLIVTATLVFGFTALAQGAYSTPPSWSPMTMLNITYSTTTYTLSVVDESTKLGAGVYPVLALDTLSTGKPDTAATTFGSFDPSQPWSVLNGTAFSRRLGWNPGSSTLSTDIQATYGTGTGIWIELISASAGLETYQAVGKYGVNSDNTLTVDASAGGYSGIFGTAGSSTKWQWDYQMDHNVYAVSSEYLVANQLYTATYKVYVGDSEGNEIFNTDGSSTATLETWTWQAPAVVPEPATLALLAIGGVISMIARKRRSMQ